MCDRRAYAGDVLSVLVAIALADDARDLRLQPFKVVAVSIKARRGVSTSIKFGVWRLRNKIRDQAACHGRPGNPGRVHLRSNKQAVEVRDPADQRQSIGREAFRTVDEMMDRGLL